MPVSTDTLLSHIDYSAWASRRLVEGSLILSREELNRDFQTADRSVLGTLVHIFAADRLWLSRLAGTPHPGFVTETDRSLPVLQNDWPVLHGKWREWAQGLSDEQALSLLSYRDLKGTPWTQPIWKLVLHVVNHATHHRGQVSGFLRSMGHTPPPIDLIHYYRELG